MNVDWVNMVRVDDCHLTFRHGDSVLIYIESMPALDIIADAVRGVCGFKPAYEEDDAWYEFNVLLTRDGIEDDRIYFHIVNSESEDNEEEYYVNLRHNIADAVARAVLGDCSVTFDELLEESELY